MSLLRKLNLLSPQRGASNAGEQSQKPQDNMLALTHLKRLFGEFKTHSRKVTQEEQESKLYSMIPLFCKVNIKLKDFLL